MSRLRDPESAIEIIASLHHDGCNYELHPLSRRALQKEHPQITIAPSLFVGYATKADFEMTHGKMWEQIISLLTGMTPKRLDHLGGVYIFDPASDRILYDTRSGQPASPAYA